jgi:hypothetical protein
MCYGKTRYSARRRGRNSHIINLGLLGSCTSNSQLEHACRAKERTLQKLQDKVRESMVKVCSRPLVA